MVAAVGFLLLDAVLLGLAAVWARRPLLFFWAAVFAAGAVGVFVVWRRYLMHLGELDAQRRDMRVEVERLRAAARRDPTN
jgi:hypothetical protein